jgi:hypothetical protein
MVVDAVLGGTWAVVAGAGIAGLSAVTWFGLPLLRRRLGR